MKLELEHNGRNATKCKLNGKDIGMSVSELKIIIDSCTMPEVEIKGRLDSLKTIIDNCNVKIEESGDDLSTK